MLDLEVAGVADHPVADRFGEYRPECAVLVEGDFVAGGDQHGDDEDRDGSGFHADGRELQCGVDVAEVDSPIGGRAQLVLDHLPGVVERRVAARAADQPTLEPLVVAVDAAVFEHRVVHRDLWTVSVEAEDRLGFVVEHREQQQPAGLGALGAEFDAVECLVADRDGVGVDAVGCLGCGMRRCRPGELTGPRR